MISVEKNFSAVVSKPPPDEKNEYRHSRFYADVRATFISRTFGLSRSISYISPAAMITMVKTATLAGRLFDNILLTLILLSVLSVLLESVRSIREAVLR